MRFRYTATVQCLSYYNKAQTVKHTKEQAISSMAHKTSLPPFLPVENPTLPFWRTELHHLDELRTTSELPKKSDIVIIGAGYTGISLAYHLYKELSHSDQPHPAITVLEARQICSGATGRNGQSPCVLHLSKMSKWILMSEFRWPFTPRPILEYPKVYRKIRNRSGGRSRKL